VVFGYLSENRRLDVMLEVLGRIRDRHRFRFDVYGELAHPEAVAKRVASLGLAGQVCLHGFVSDAVLVEALEEADLAINLRFPTMGEASYSQLRLWGQEVPSLVTQVGWYAEQPPETVAFVRPQCEVADVEHHLEALAASPQTYRKMAECGRRWLTEQHDPAHYVRKLLNLAAEVDSLRRRALALGAAHRAGRCLSEWLGNDASDSLLSDIACRIAVA
jgi:glycosyltransferase involved in cell wall biosynthesis